MVYYWERDWEAFRRQHRPWLERHAPGSAVLYRLPEPIFSALGRPLAHGRPILATDELDAERAFDVLCGRHHAEGVADARAVVYHHLRPPTPPPTPEQFRCCGFSDPDIAQVRAGLRHSRELLARGRGYLGRLVTDPTFLAARDALRERWRALPAAERPGLPLRRASEDLPGAGAGHAGPALAHFQTLFEDFLDRYGLLGMATWELPDPAGPLLDGLPRPPHLLAGRPVQIAVPAHFRLQRTDDLQGLVRDLQGRQTRAAGLDPSCVGPRSAESYARLLEIDHFRRVADGRYGRPPRPKGYVGRLHDALAAYLDIGPEHFRTLQRARDGFLRGKPHTGPWAS